MSVNSCVKIKVEEDYDQVMIEEHLSCEDDASDLSGNTPTATLNIHESQPRDSGKQPISSLTQTRKRWNLEGQRGNCSSPSTRGQSSVSLTCSVGMEQVGQSSLDVTQEYDGQLLYGEDGSLSKDSFGTDQLRTLGEILAYCQVMYGAIQKLDEKFEQLQAKVTNIHLIQVTSKTPSAPTNRHPSVVSVDTSSVPDPALSMPQLVRVCSPPPPPSVEVKRPPALSPAPRLPSPLSLPSQGPNDSLVKSVVAAHLSNHPIPLHKPGEKQIPSQGSNDTLVNSVVAAHLSNHPIPLNKAVEKQIPSHSYTIPGASPKTVWLGSRKRNVCISQSALQKAKQMSKPGRAVRFLMRCVFSIEEMSCSNTLGDATRGLKKLDPNKLSAIREWLARRYPEYDLKEKGKDWRKCMSVMNSTARYLRLMAKRRRLKMQKDGEETVKPPYMTDTHIEPIPETEAEPEAELSEDNYVAEIEDLVELENYPNITEMGEPIQEYTAEIDVELSESEEEEDASSKTQTEKEEESNPMSRSEVAYEYLGNPERNVKVPQYAMFTALQRTRPELAARVLIKYMFPEEVLVVSNVHGNNESGIRALDHNKISALREHLLERFPWLLLEEDGQDWKVCVGAINSTIRKFRHDLKMGRGRKKGT